VRNQHHTGRIIGRNEEEASLSGNHGCYQIEDTLWQGIRVDLGGKLAGLLKRVEKEPEPGVWWCHTIMPLVVGWRGVC
jgi:hypothetical protein